VGCRNRLRKRAASIMGQWNDTDEPIAFLITFRTCGTWLARDESGSVDKFHNEYGGPRAIQSERRKEIHADRLKGPPVILSAAARKIVEVAIREVCEFRGWPLPALSVRTNHVHAVTAAVSFSSKILNDFKSYSTRRMREKGEWLFAHSPWVDKRSRRYLWNEDHISRACDYVLNGQGGPLPEFD
jgi:REP element-mobilizing transposase RayT